MTSKYADILARIEARIREEWPGTHVVERGVWTAPEIRDGGATDTLVKLIIQIADEELENI